MAGAQEFYDDLAGDYHLLFADWWEAAGWHAGIVASVLASEGVAPPASLLDCSCGIGTQALPLAELGFAVVGTDVSTAAVSRARAEAAERGVTIELAVADVRRVAEVVGGAGAGFDAAISCDNALPHLLTDEDLGAALRSIRGCLAPGGVFLASIRDYDSLRRDRPAGVPVTVHGPPGARHASGQSWRWSGDGELVSITLFTLEEGGEGGGWRGTSRETTYRALTRATLTSALEAEGFTGVTWLMPDETGYHQPIVTARRDL